MSARRGLGSLLLTLGMLAATLAALGLSAQRTLFDTQRTVRVADAVLADGGVRTALTQQLADALQSRLPPGTPLDPAQLTAVAERAFADPRFLTATTGAIADAQERLVGRGEPGPVRLDAGPATAALADAAGAVDPRLRPAIAGAPLSLELPLKPFPRAKELDGLTGRWPLAGAAALGLWALALLVTTARGKALIRLGFFLLGLSLVQVVLLLVLPRVLLPQLGSGWPAFAGSLISAWAGGVVWIYGAAAAAGVAFLLLGLAVRGAEATGRSRSGPSERTRRPPVGTPAGQERYGEDTYRRPASARAPGAGVAASDGREVPHQLFPPGTYPTTDRPPPPAWRQDDQPTQALPVHPRSTEDTQVIRRPDSADPDRR